MKNKKILRYFIMNILFIFYNIHSAEHNSLVVGTAPQPSQDIQDISKAMRNILDMFKDMSQTQQNIMQDIAQVQQVQQNMVQPQQNCQETNSDRIITGVCYFGATVIGIYLFHKFKVWASPNELDPVNKSVENIRKKVYEIQKRSDTHFDSTVEKQTDLQEKFVALGVNIQNTHNTMNEMYREYRTTNAAILFSYDIAKNGNNLVLEEEYAKLLRNINQNSQELKDGFSQINFEKSIHNTLDLSTSLNEQEKILDDRINNQQKQAINNQLKIQQLNTTIDFVQAKVNGLRRELRITNFVEQTEQPKKTIDYKPKGAQFLPKGKGEFRVTSSNKQLKSSVQNDPQPQPLPAPDNSKKSSATIFWAEN